MKGFVVIKVDHEEKAKGKDGGTEQRKSVHEISVTFMNTLL